jgi:hypothetical protein
MMKKYLTTREIMDEEGDGCGTWQGAISFFGGIGSGCGRDKNVCFGAHPSIKGDK